MYSDPHHEHAIAAAREATLTARAHSLSYRYGQRVGQILEASAAAAEVEFLGQSHEMTIELGEAIREGYWHELDLPSDLIDHHEVERGMCAGSQRYAEARAVESVS